MGNRQSAGTQHVDEQGMVDSDLREGFYGFGKKLTVREGERFEVWTGSGKRRVVDGPKAVRPFYSTVEKAKLYQCSPDEYLKVEYKDGTKEHLRGPQYLYFDSVSISRITVCQSEKLEGNEAIVVYREIREDTAQAAPRQPSGPENDGPPPKREGSSVAVATDTANRVERRIVHGPTIFIPASNEWIHEFSWHGAITERGGSKTGYPGDTKVAHACEFTKIRIMPDHMYLTVRDIRTKDDAKINLHLMLYFVLNDIDTMLDNTNDPIGEFMNAAGADMMSFGAERIHDKLLEDSYLLNDKKLFPILSGRMPLIGYELLKVVYRGYDTSAKLQLLQEQAIAQRTEMGLKTETLKANLARIEQENQLDKIKADYARQKREAKEEEVMQAKQAAHKQKLEQEKELEDARLEIERKKNQERLAYLSSLKQQGVDLTQYLVAATSSRPTEHFLVESRGGNAAHVHVNNRS